MVGYAVGQTLYCSTDIGATDAINSRWQDQTEEETAGGIARRKGTEGAPVVFSRLFRKEPSATP